MRPPLSAELGQEYRDAFAAEILRWNSQINLISRVDPEAVVAALIQQCREAFAALRDALGADSWFGAGRPLDYTDLGSGGGLPGVIWNLEMRLEGMDATALLVEPRAKRAWFLERVAALLPEAGFGVASCRWGESLPAASVLRGRQALVSLKALRLTDEQVLAGLAAARGGNDNPAEKLDGLVIARFHPPDQAMGETLARDLGFPRAGEGIPIQDHALVWQGCKVLGPTPGKMPASLVLSEYRAT